ncbi:MAG: VanZ family protein [Rhodocyclaceae bacterium]|nr:VanZ family protein [Rhodocyclaceae bacterium]MBX3669131.1 VanZ family protein [Rhodocyclaceae bacterium]
MSGGPPAGSPAAATPQRGPDAPNPARLLVLAYAALIILASTNPFTGWRDPQVPPWQFLLGAWPRFFTTFDLITNLLAYVPLGYLLVPALQPRLKPGWAAVAAALMGCALSLCMESLQTYLPTRVASKLDLLTNSAGSLAGAACGLFYGNALTLGGKLHRWRVRRIVRGRVGDAAIALLLAWLFGQLDPETQLFSQGDLRGLLGLPAPVDFTAQRFASIEAAVAGATVLAVGLLGWQSMRRPSPWPLLAVFGLGMGVKCLSGALLVRGAAWTQWLTPGALAGAAAGVVVCALVLSRREMASLRLPLAAIALMAATALINLAPESPYLASTVRAWRAGNFLNFNGATRLAAALWPFVALPFIMLLQARSAAATDSG